MFIGSEGILGIITEAWMRLQDRPTFRAGASVPFPNLLKAAEAVRQISQAGLFPANCRVLDEGEAFNSGAGDGKEAVLVLAFESKDHALEPWMKRALECCADHGGKIPSEAAKTRTDADATHEGSAGAWRNSFLNAPYLMDTVAAMGMVSNTFETSITWERFPEFHRAMIETASDAIKRVCGKGSVTCRFTHVYPDGPAPYYTVLAPGKRGSQIEQWDEIKAAVSDKLIALGGTITHHHAVGRFHRRWYDRQRPEGFATALRAAKKALDPKGILNAGVLIDP
jgi:alkyldihydroxyacetonephosphate synthase